MQDECAGVGEGNKKGIDPDAKKDMQELVRRMSSGDFGVEEAREARLGIEHGLTPSEVGTYFQKGLSYEVMEQIRLLMEAGKQKEDGKNERGIVGGGAGGAGDEPDRVRGVHDPGEKRSGTDENDDQADFLDVSQEDIGRDGDPEAPGDQG
ncbi:MAG TPA: hypothetical protein PLN48_11350 [Lachnospiraceae bacterium]|nr:hypothetical protein [Lachnospiraceae bacterium]